MSLQQLFIIFVAANTMYQSFKAGEAVTDPNVDSIAFGLAPPMAGE